MTNAALTLGRVLADCEVAEDALRRAHASLASIAVTDPTRPRADKLFVECTRVKNIAHGLVSDVSSMAEALQAVGARNG